MKRVMALVLSGMLMILLTACQPSEKKVMEAIDAIGTVTMASLEQIESAEALYNELEEADREKVANRNVLEEARKEYDRQEALINEAIKAVDRIGIIALSSETRIAAAREAYELALPYDCNGALQSSEEALMSAQKRYNQRVEDAQTVLEEANKLYEAGEYVPIEEMLSPYIAELPKGEQKTAFANTVMKSLCAEAQALYEDSDSMNALKTLKRCYTYKGHCDTELEVQSDQLTETITNELKKKTPKNGAILDRTYGAGRNTIEVTAGPMDTCAKLQLVDDPEKYIVFFIRANETVKLNLLNGNYVFKYTCGPVWYDEVNMFGSDATFIEEFTVELAGYTSQETYTMYYHYVETELQYGYTYDWGMQNISPEDF